MATYKAEFRAHYYERRRRPRAAYSMGLIHLWSRAASRVPGLANFLTQTPGISSIVKFLGGLAQERRMPAYAKETFRDWFVRRAPRPVGSKELVLFPDTFNNFFRPTTAIAAVHVLEAAGWRVTIPSRLLCCARPLYDWGMLDRAKALVGELLETLGPALARDVPVVGLEPACIAAFRDEIPALFPADERAHRLAKQALLFTEFIDRHCGDMALPQLAERTALVQIHCHEHSVLDPTAEKRVLKRMGVDAEIMPTGCCGMAGSFGFEADKCHWSKKIAEQTLLPRLRQAPTGALVLASGFSCREQIEQGSEHETRHPAQIIALAMGFAPASIRPSRDPATQLLAAGSLIAAGLLLGFTLGRRDQVLRR
jgi:Fe-S oxidoreductase